jgi:hypothetical protein
MIARTSYGFVTLEYEAAEESRNAVPHHRRRLHELIVWPALSSVNRRSL